MVLSAIITYSFFIVWNRPSTLMFERVLPPLENYNIEFCYFGEKDIKVTGWAVIPGSSYMLNRIYAKENNGKWVELMSSTVLRGDVSTAFKSPYNYDRSGFIATRRDKTARDNFTREIMIVTLSRDGGEYAVKYQCQ